MSYLTHQRTQLCRLPPAGTGSGVITIGPPSTRRQEHKLRRTSGRRSGTRHGRGPDAAIAGPGGGSAWIRFREGRGPDVAPALPNMMGLRELGKHLRPPWRLLRRCVGRRGLIDRGSVGVTVDGPPAVVHPDPSQPTSRLTWSHPLAHRSASSIVTGSWVDHMARRGAGPLWSACSGFDLAGEGGGEESSRSLMTASRVGSLVSCSSESVRSPVSLHPGIGQARSRRGFVWRHAGCGARAPGGGHTG